MAGIPDGKGNILKNATSLFAELSKKYPRNNYTLFCNEFGVGFDQANDILKGQNLGNQESALKQVLNMWLTSGKDVDRAKLESALENAETGGLKSIVRKHFKKDAVNDEEESSEDEEDEEEEEEEEESEESDSSEESSEEKAPDNRTIYVAHNAAEGDPSWEDCEDVEVEAVFEPTTYPSALTELGLEHLVKNCHNPEEWRKNSQICSELSELFKQRGGGVLYKISFKSVHFFVRVRLGASKDTFLRSCKDGTLSRGLTKLLVFPELEEAAGVKLKVRLDVVAISKARTFQTNVEIPKKAPKADGDVDGLSCSQKRPKSGTSEEKQPRLKINAADSRIVSGNLMIETQTNILNVYQSDEPKANKQKSQEATTSHQKKPPKTKESNYKTSQKEAKTVAKEKKEEASPPKTPSLKATKPKSQKEPTPSKQKPEETNKTPQKEAKTVGKPKEGETSQPKPTGPKRKSRKATTEPERNCCLQ